MLDNTRFTSPPCRSCMAHNTLETETRKLSKENTAQHRDLWERLDKVVIDISWIKSISKAILLTMFTYLLSIGYYIFTLDNVSQHEFDKINAEVHEVKKLRDKDEKTLNKMNGKLEILIREVGHK